MAMRLRAYPYHIRQEAGGLLGSPELLGFIEVKHELVTYNPQQTLNSLLLV